MLTFKDFINIDNTPFLVKKQGGLSDSTDIILYHKSNSKLSPNSILMYKGNTPIGFISCYYDEEVDVYCISGSYVIGKYQGMGYGKFLYETVMTMVDPKGISMTRDSNTSPSAVSVWESFDNRSDIKKERINYKGTTHKREDLPIGMSNDKKYVDKVLRIEDTRFFYSYGKDKLENQLKEPLSDYDDVLDIMIDRM